MSARTLTYTYMYLFSIVLVVCAVSTSHAEEKLPPPPMNDAPPPPDFDQPANDSTPRINRLIERMDGKLALSGEQKSQIKNILLNARNDPLKERDNLGMNNRTDGQQRPRESKREMRNVTRDRMDQTVRAIEMVLDSDQQKKFKKMRHELKEMLSERGRRPIKAQPGNDPMNRK
ncbi:MAG: hypothetical protein OEM52_04150 [bacterium]|nr:hypothetical protein [bacterium]